MMGMREGGKDKHKDRKRLSHRTFQCSSERLNRGGTLTSCYEKTLRGGKTGQVWASCSDGKRSKLVRKESYLPEVLRNGKEQKRMKKVTSEGL